MCGLMKARGGRCAPFGPHRPERLFERGGKILPVTQIGFQHPVPEAASQIVQAFNVVCGFSRQRAIFFARMRDPIVHARSGQYACHHTARVAIAAQRNNGHAHPERFTCGRVPAPREGIEGDVDFMEPCRIAFPGSVVAHVDPVSGNAVFFKSR